MRVTSNHVCSLSTMILTPCWRALLMIKRMSSRSLPSSMRSASVRPSSIFGRVTRGEGEGEEVTIESSGSLGVCGGRRSALGRWTQ